MATEKRLIDAIALISKAQRMETTDNNGIPIDTFAVPVLTIEDAPTVHAVEVIRCKDCKHNHRVINHITHNDQCFCTASRVYYPEVMPEHFCGYGERKNNNEG